MKNDSAAFGFLAHPYRLVSLLEMLRVNVEEFLNVQTRLDSLIRALPENDDRLSAEELELYSLQRNPIDNLDYVLRVCLNAHLGGIDGQIQRIMNILTSIPTNRHLRVALTALQERIYDALAERVFMQVTPDNADYYNKKTLFGSEVEASFPSASYDIEEAGKCYACNRNTACVMHLSRVLEVGLKALTAALNLPPVPLGKQPSWSQVLRDVWDEIGKQNKLADPGWMTEKKSFFENAHADLSSVKNAWRNPSMHADKVYDPERAEDIFNSVKALMRGLAKHLDEAGNFTT